MTEKDKRNSNSQYKIMDDDYVHVEETKEHAGEISNIEKLFKKVQCKTSLVLFF
jgi:hypothetical protein